MQFYFSIYRLPKQPLKEFETFTDNLELNLDTIARSSPFLIVLLSGLNAKLNKWY